MNQNKFPFWSISLVGLYLLVSVDGQTGPTGDVGTTGASGAISSGSKGHTGWQGASGPYGLTGPAGSWGSATDIKPIFVYPEENILVNFSNGNSVGFIEGYTVGLVIDHTLRFEVVIGFRPSVNILSPGTHLEIAYPLPAEFPAAPEASLVIHGEFLPPIIGTTNGNIQGTGCADFWIENSILFVKCAIKSLQTDGLLIFSLSLTVFYSTVVINL